LNALTRCERPGQRQIPATPASDAARESYPGVVPPREAIPATVRRCAVRPM
jgi:hypothetical protein